MKLTTNLLLTTAAGLMLFSQMANAQTSVTVDNTSSNPVLTQSLDSIQPYTYSVSWTVSGTGGNGPQIPIPPGKRFVVQYVSFAGATQSTTGMALHLTTNALASTGSTPGNNIHYLLLTPQPVSQGNVMWIYSAPVAIYAEGPGITPVTAPSALTSQAPGNIQATLTVSGYLVTE